MTIKATGLTFYWVTDQHNIHSVSKKKLRNYRALIYKMIFIPNLMIANRPQASDLNKIGTVIMALHLNCIFFGFIILHKNFLNKTCFFGNKINVRPYLVVFSKSIGIEITKKGARYLFFETPYILHYTYFSRNRNVS